MIIDVEEFGYLMINAFSETVKPQLRKLVKYKSTWTIIDFD